MKKVIMLRWSGTNVPVPAVEVGKSIDDNEPVYCICGKNSDGKWIKCDNDLCIVEWFHFDCVEVKTKTAPKNWYCPTCRSRDDSTKRKSNHFLEKTLIQHEKKRRAKAKMTRFIKRQRSTSAVQN